MSTTLFIILVLSHIAAFIVGALVFRSNEKEANKIANAGDAAIKDVTNVTKKL